MEYNGFEKLVIEQLHSLNFFGLRILFVQILELSILHYGSFSFIGESLDFPIVSRWLYSDFSFISSV